MDSRVVGSKKLCLLVQVWGNQGVRISHDLWASWSVTIQGWDLSGEKQQMVHVVQRMDHMVHSIQSDHWMGEGGLY